MSNKTNELCAFERLINDRMRPEMPVDAGHVRLRAASENFIDLIERLHADHHEKSVNKIAGGDEQ